MEDKIKVLDPRVQKLIRTYPEVFGELPPLASCDKLVQMNLKLKPEFVGHKIRRRPYPAPKEQANEIERQIQECIDAALVLEYKDGDYPQRCSPCFLVAKPGSTAKRPVVDYEELNKKTLNHAIYKPLGRKTPIGKPGWGSMLSVVERGLVPVPWEDPDPAMVQEFLRESSGYTLDVLKHQLRPRDAVETTPGGDEYVVSDTAACNSPCRVPNPDVVSECGLSELPSSIHSDDETEHDAFFVPTCVEEVENAEYAAPQKPLLSMR